MKIVNNSAAPVEIWNVSVAVGATDTLVSGWNANVTKAGSTVSASNLSYNGALQPGQETTFGFQAGFTGSQTTPTCQ
jgi:cellulase/cellobiase CelA1